MLVIYYGDELLQRCNNYGDDDGDYDDDNIDNDDVMNDVDDCDCEGYRQTGFALSRLTLPPTQHLARLPAVLIRLNQIKLW